MTDTVRLWQPEPLETNQSLLADYIHFLAEEDYGTFADYDDLWHWSVTSLTPSGHLYGSLGTSLVNEARQPINIMTTSDKHAFSRTQKSIMLKICFAMKAVKKR